LSARQNSISYRIAFKSKACGFAARATKESTLQIEVTESQHEERTDDDASRGSDWSSAVDAESEAARIGAGGVELGVVVLADEAAGDEREAVSRHEPAPADGAREAVDVVGVVARAHHQLRRGDRLTTRRTHARRPEHPAVQTGV